MTFTQQIIMAAFGEWLLCLLLCAVWAGIINLAKKETKLEQANQKENFNYYSDRITIWPVNDRHDFFKVFHCCGDVVGFYSIDLCRKPSQDQG